MNNFMIGMQVKYDNEKFARDFGNGFYGMQVCQFTDEKEIDIMLREMRSCNFKVGVHFPLRSWAAKHRDPQFLSLDKATEAYAYTCIEEELQYMKRKEFSPEFVLFHYPKPAILKADFDLTYWRFYDRSEYTYENEYPFEELKLKSDFLFQWLTQKSMEYGFIPVLELDTLNKYVTGSDLLESLLEKYPSVRLCLDTGRIHMQKMIDNEFDDLDIFRRFSKYAYIIHLWNAWIASIGHYPALPGLKPEEGWAPIAQYF